MIPSRWLPHRKLWLGWAALRYHFFIKSGTCYGGKQFLYQWKVWWDHLVLQGVESFERDKNSSVKWVMINNTSMLWCFSCWDYQYEKKILKHQFLLQPIVVCYVSRRTKRSKILCQKVYQWFWKIETIIGRMKCMKTICWSTTACNYINIQKQLRPSRLVGGVQQKKTA